MAAGRLNPDKIDERTVARHLYVPEQSDADMVWRTSGEQRLSNFMLWQAAYSELVFTDVLWPDVDRRHLWAAIEEYAARNRRYGESARFTLADERCSATVFLVTGRLREELRRLWLEPRDPRLLQLGFSLLFLLDMALRVAGDIELRTGPMIGLVLVPVIWVVTLVVPWTRAPEWCRVALLVVDIGLVGLSRLDPVGGSALLVVIPALWLGFVYGVRGAVVTGVATVLLVMVPGLIYVGVTGVNLSRSVTATVIAVTVALAIANVDPAGARRPGADRAPAPGR